MNPFTLLLEHKAKLLAFNIYNYILLDMFILFLDLRYFNFCESAAHLLKYPQILFIV